MANRPLRRRSAALLSGMLSALLSSACAEDQSPGGSGSGGHGASGEAAGDTGDAPAGGGTGVEPAASGGGTPATDDEGPGYWLKGDLHAHSNHSTDALDTTVAAVFAKAEEFGFDYFTLTDHDNHVQGELTTWSDPDYRSDTLILLYGVEWTTDLGHANIFGAEPFDHAPMWAARSADGVEAIAAAHDQGLHFSANHIMAKDLWEYSFDLEYDSIEVWCAPFVIPNSNPKAVTRWEELLLAGRRVAARGGSDSHHQVDFESTLFNIGNPTTWIYARTRTGRAVLDGLGAGHASISYAPSAERLDFVADADGDGEFETLIGDNLEDHGGQPLAFKIEVVGFRADAGYTLTVFKNGAALRSFSPLDEPTVTFDDTPAAGERSHYRVELRGTTPEAPEISAVGFGDFIAMTNPIYVGFP